MIDSLIHYGPLAFLVACPLISAARGALRSHRHTERGEVLSFTIDDGFVWRVPN
jgi:hypothetical protein